MALVCPLLAVVACVASPSAANPPAEFESAISQGRQALDALVQESATPGLSVAVAVDGQVVWAEAFGSASLELGVAADEHTRFRIASISKPLTAVALMRLVDAGRVSLDTPIASLGDDLGHLPASLTVAHLARHAGGIRHYKTGEIAVDEHYPTLTDAVTIFSEDELLFAPGTGYRYTTFGYTLLGLAMERSAGESFAQLMNSQVYRPLGMRDTAMEHWYLVTPNRSESYEYRAEHGIINAQASDNSCRLPGGGTLSTATDLVRFGSALLTPGFISETSLKRMFSETRLPDGTKTGYAMGWMLDRDAWGRPVYRHNGSQPGARGQLVIYPEQRVVIAMLANVSRAPIGFDEAQAIAQPFIEPMTAEATADPIGTYRLSLVGQGSPPIELHVWREFDGPLVASALIPGENRRIMLDSVHVAGARVRAIGYSLRDRFDGQLAAVTINLDDDSGHVLTSGRLIPVRVEKIK